MAALLLFLVIVVGCCSRPSMPAGSPIPIRSGPNINGTITIGGKEQPVLETSTEGLPGSARRRSVRPGISIPYFLGADDQGRDVFARLLYGGLNSLAIAGAATVLCLVAAAALGVIAGFFGGVVDATLSRNPRRDLGLPDLPAGDLAVDRADQQEHRPGVIVITPQSLAPHLPLSVSSMFPISRARSRGQVLSLKKQRVVLAAIGLGVPGYRISGEGHPAERGNDADRLRALDDGAEHADGIALSFLSIGVQPPDASWRHHHPRRQNLLYTRPIVALAPGIAIAVTVLALNVFGDGVRDALDPRAKLRIGRTELRC